MIIIYAENLKKSIKNKEKMIRKKINSIDGLILYRDYFYPNMNNINFNNINISKVACDLYKKEKKIDKNMKKISMLKGYFSSYKSACLNKKKINLKDIVFWSEFLETNIIDLLSIEREKYSKENNLFNGVYFYIPEKVFLSLVKYVQDTENNMHKDYKKMKIEPIVIPLAIHITTGSILYVHFIPMRNSYIGTQYYMSYYSYSKLLTIISDFPAYRHKLSKIIKLGTEYISARNEFILKCEEQITMEHSDAVGISLAMIKRSIPDLYKTIANSCNYLKRLLHNKNIDKNEKYSL